MYNLPLSLNLTCSVFVLFCPLTNPRCMSHLNIIIFFFLLLMSFLVLFFLLRVYLPITLVLRTFNGDMGHVGSTDMDSRSDWTVDIARSNSVCIEDLSIF